MRYLQRQSSCDGIDLRAVAQTTSNQTYEQMRPYLFAVAYRMTGSASDAEDLVQDAGSVSLRIASTVESVAIVQGESVCLPFV